MRQPIMTIDPGANGGIAIEANTLVSVFKIPVTLAGKVDILTRLQREYPGIKCWMEKGSTHRKGNAATRSATFAEHVGELRGIMATLGIPFTGVTPQTWMRIFPDRPKSPHEDELRGLSAQEQTALQNQRRRERKNYIKEKVQKEFHVITVHLWNADALGILMWAQERKER